MTARRRSFPALDGDCLPGQSLLRLSSRPGASMRISRRIAALAALGLAAGALAGCSGAGPAVPPGSAGQPAAGGPVVTLRVAVYGSPGYRRAGLFAAYQRLHPGIRIVEHATAQEPGYWQALRQHLATGRGLDDLVAIPLARMSEAETGPLALCYRPQLLAEAGLPSSPARLARDWSTWQGYLASGREFKQRIPSGPAFMDSVTSVYNAIMSQAGPAPGQAAPGQAAPGQAARSGPAADPAVQRAWASAAKAAKDGLSAGLAPQSRAWDTGVTRLAFATTVCPPWLLGTIQRLSGSRGAGTWAVTAVPGGTGDWGGFYLAIPRSSAHQQDAYQLAVYLAGQQAGPALAQTGAFPASSPAINAAGAVSNPYFGNSPTGRIFALAATRMPATGTPDPTASALAPLIATALAQVRSGTLTPAEAWSRLLHKAG